LFNQLGGLERCMLRRGKAEQWIKEGKNAVTWTKLSCCSFKDNQTRLQWFALAYNLVVVQKITHRFSISSSRHLRPFLNRESST